MTKKWSDVAASAAFQSLSFDEQEEARQQYFAEVVAPQVGDDVDTARTQFDADTAIKRPAPRPAAAPQPAAEKPSFWGEVGNVLTSAKDYVTDTFKDKPESVMENYVAPKPATTTKIEDLGAPVTDAYYDKVRKSYASADSKTRLEMEAQPNLAGQVARGLRAKTQAMPEASKLVEKRMTEKFTIGEQGAEVRRVASEDRTIVETAGDIARDVSIGMTQLFEAPANIIAPESEYAETLRGVRQELQEGYSEKLQARQEVMRQKIAEDEGFADKFVNTLSSLVMNPSMAVSEVVKQMPNLVAMVGVARAGAVAGAGAVGLAGRASPTLAIGEAISGGSLAARGAQVGATAGGMGSSVVLTAGDAAGNTYEALTNPDITPASTWRDNPDFQRLVAGGMSPEDAIKSVAKDRAQLAGLMAAPLGVLGFMGAEASIVARGLAGRAGTSMTGKEFGKVLGKELVTEQIEEGGTQVSSNIMQRTVNPHVKLDEGVAQAMATAAVAAGGITTATNVAPLMRNFTPDDSLSAEMGLSPIVVPTVTRPRGDEDVSRDSNAPGLAADSGRPASIDLNGGMEGAGLPPLGERGGLGPLSGGVDAGAGPAGLVQPGASEQLAPVALPRLADRATDDDLLARVQGTLAPAENTVPAPQPTTVMMSRGGNGYATQQDAAVALQVGMKREPDMEWKIEPIEGDRFRVAAYARAAVAEIPAMPARAEVAAPASPTGEWTAFTPDTGTLGIPRAEMPQIKAEHRGAMVNFLNARGVTHAIEEVQADTLKPTQAEFSTEKVAKARDYTGGDRSILISSDNHVVDGHHQWLAKKEAGEPVKVIRLNAPIAELLDTVKEFPSATLDDSAAPAAPQPAGATSAVPMVEITAAAPAPILPPSGKPFSTPKMADVYAKANKIADYQAVKIDGGWAIQPATPIAETSAPAVQAAPIVQASGEPFKTEKGAMLYAQQQGIEAPVTVSYKGGFAIAPQETTNGTAESATTGGIGGGQQRSAPVLDAPDTGGLGPTEPRGARQTARALFEVQVRNGKAEPLDIGEPSPEDDAAVQEIGELFASTFGGGLPVVAFSSDDPSAPNGLTIGKVAFVNTSTIQRQRDGSMVDTGALDVSAPRTALHEFKHVVEQIAAAETRAGQTNTPAQQFTASIDSIFDDMTDDGKRAYIENFLHFDELKDMGEVQRETRIQNLMSKPMTRSEMTADFLGNRAQDKEFWKLLAARDPKGFKGFVEKWLDIINNLTAKLRGSKAQGKKESARVDGYVRDLGRAKMVAMDALIAYRKGAGAAAVDIARPVSARTAALTEKEAALNAQLETARANAAGRAAPPAPDVSESPRAATPAQRRSGGTAARERLQQSNPFMAFLAEKGIALEERSDLGIEPGKNRMVPGYGPLFRRAGLRLDELAQMANEAGFLTDLQMADDTDNAGVNQLSDMIQQALAGDTSVGKPAEDIGAAMDEQRDAEMLAEAQSMGIETDGKTADEVYDLLMAAVNGRDQAIADSDYAAAMAEVEALNEAQASELRDTSLRQLIEELQDAQARSEAAVSGQSTDETAAEPEGEAAAGGRTEAFSLESETPAQARLRQQIREKAERDSEDGIAFSQRQAYKNSDTLLPLNQPKKGYQNDLFADQGDLFANIETRPGTTEAQRDAGRSAVADLARRLGVDRIGRRGNAAGSQASVLGSRLLANFVAGKSNQLVGQTVSTPADLAVLAQVYRDPRFETFRVLYMNGDKVAGEAGYTSRLPAAVIMPPNLMQQVQDDLKRFGASGYYIMHNHPSGDPTPSRADQSLTNAIDGNVPGFLGHVVIDHNKYAVIQNWGHEVFDAPELNGTDFTAIPEVENKLLGLSANSPSSVAMIGKALQVKGGFGALILTSAGGKVQLLVDIPMAVLKRAGSSKQDRAETKAVVRRMARESGSGGSRFIVLPDGADFSAFRPLLADGILTDVVSADGASLRERGAYAGENFLDKNMKAIRVSEERRKYADQRTIEIDGKRRPIENSKGQKVGANFKEQAAFWRWFGDSKAVDAQGRPLVVYHGTSDAGFSFFDTYASNYGLMGMGGYFTADPAVASSYTIKGRGDAPGVYAVYVSTKNPIDMDAPADPALWQRQFEGIEEYHEGGETNESWYRAAEDLLGDQGLPRWEGAEAMQDGLRAMGFDGITHLGGGRVQGDSVRHQVYIAFDPTQIKSATGNAGTFDPENADIRFSNRQVETPAFKKWFGDSKVVNADGKPLVVYHGTDQSFNSFAKEKLGDATGAQSAGQGFFFVARADVATSYANYAALDAPVRREIVQSEKAEKRGDWDGYDAAIQRAESLEEEIGNNRQRGQNVLPVYLSIQNPAVMDAGGELFTSMQDEINSFIKKAKRIGNDGVIIKNLDDDPRFSDRVGDHYLVFSPTQIKSATGNNGDFDAGNDDIRFSNRQAPVTIMPANARHYQLAPETRTRAARRNLQDYFLRVKEVQEVIASQGGTVDEQQDVYQAETLSYGRMQEQIRDFKEKVVQPLLEDVQKRGLSLSDLALYAYALHAPERNAAMQKINPKLPDGTGSGMTDDEAAEILAAAKAEGYETDLKELHGKLQAITKSTRDLLLREGLIAQDEYDAWTGAYQNYVPLRGFVEEETDEVEGRPVRGMKVGGKGFNVRGAESIKALGRTSMAGHVIENIVNDYERAVARAERNEVAKVFLNLVTTNPDANLWEIDTLRTTASFSKKDQVVTYNQLIDKGEDTISVKLAGKEVYIKVKDEILLRAMKQAGKDDTGATTRILMKSLGWYTAFMRNVLTRYNPAFGAMNAVKDFGFGAVSALADLGPKGMALYSKNYMTSLGANFRAEIGRTDLSKAIDRQYEEFRASGATTGGWHMRDLQEMRKELANLMVEFGAEPQTAAQKLIATRGLKQAYSGSKKIFRMLELVGALSENQARFAAYRAARELGKSPAESGKVAKELTTNFNRKGEWGSAMNTTYLFFNAGVQGSAKMLGNLKSPKVQALMGGMVGLTTGLALMGAAVGGDDDDGEAFWDKIPQFEKERNLIIMLPPAEGLEGAERIGSKGRYLKIPVQYGLNVFTTLGYTLADLARYAANPLRGKSPARAAINTVSSMATSFNPLGGAVDLSDPVSIGMAVAPSIADVGIQFGANVDGFGRPTSPKRSPFDKNPDSENFGPALAGTWEQRLARWMNEKSGGDEAVSGAIDLAPGTIRNLKKNLTGGTGDFISSVFVNIPVKMMTPEAEIGFRDMPVVKGFYGRVDDNIDMSLYYERRAEVLDAAEAAGRRAKMGIEFNYDEKSLGLQSLGEAAKQYTKAMTALKREEIRLLEDTETPKKQREIEIKEIKKEQSALARDFNAAYMGMRKEVQAGGFK